MPAVPIRPAALQAATPFQLIRDQRGVTYLGLMFLIVLMGVYMSVIAQQWSFVLKRDREAELQFRGNRIKRAIEKYSADYEVKKTERDHPLPRTLDELTKPTAYLPAAYKDPITGKDWEYIINQEFIYGVRSRSHGKPLNKMVFQEAKTYHDVVYKAEGALRQNCSRSGLNTKSGVNEIASSRLDQNSFISQSKKDDDDGSGSKSGRGVCGPAGGMGGMGMGMPGMGMGMPGMGMGMPGMGMGMRGMGMGMPGMGMGGMGMGTPGMGMGMPGMMPGMSGMSGRSSGLNSEPFQNTGTGAPDAKQQRKTKKEKSSDDSGNDFDFSQPTEDEQAAGSPSSPTFHQPPPKPSRSF